MKELIAYCGLDCEKCDARIATLNNDDALREKTARKWSELNEFDIKPEMINCTGCRSDGAKTYFCENMCDIRKCAVGKKLDSCKDCRQLHSCKTVKQVTTSNAEAAQTLGIQ